MHSIVQCCIVIYMYSHLRTKEIQEDPRQEVCMKMLDDLARHLEGYSPKMQRAKAQKMTPKANAGLLGGFFGKPAPKPKAAEAVNLTRV